MLKQLLGLAGLVALLGFIAFAFRKGMEVTPDRNNSNFGPGSYIADGGDGPSGFGGDSS